MMTEAQQRNGVGVATEVYPIAWRADEALKELEAGNLDEVRFYLSEIRRELNISLLHDIPTVPYYSTESLARYRAFVAEMEAEALKDTYTCKGRAGGREWALQASYEDLESVAVACAKGYITTTDGTADKVNEILYRESEATGDPSLAKDGTAYECWEEGWISGVHAAYLEVKAEINRVTTGALIALSSQATASMKAEIDPHAAGGVKDDCEIGDICFNDCDQCGEDQHAA